MRKIFYVVIYFLVLSIKCYAQTSPGNNLTEKDSLEIMNELTKLLDANDDPKSFAIANVGIGNRLFSIKNNAFNAFQSTSSKLIYSPSLGYFHKTGFGLTAGANLLNDGSGLIVNQYSLSPSFDLTGNKNIAFDISYAHYFVKDKYSAYSSPIQNDFYTAFTYKKTWLQPGIALGYATGEYKETKYKDTVIAGIRKHFYDSINNKLKVFSIMLSASHEFNWYNILNKTDGLFFTPTLMVNAGSGETAISHKTNATILFNLLNRKGRIPKIQKSKFELQSIGLNMNLGYDIGNFSFTPQLYIDYYLPAIEPGSNRITPVFTFNIGYYF
jgi:hypothetical protein